MRRGIWLSLLFAGCATTHHHPLARYHDLYFPNAPLTLAGAEHGLPHTLELGSCERGGRRLRWFATMGLTHSRDFAYDADSGRLVFVNDEYQSAVDVCGCYPPPAFDEFGAAPCEPPYR